MASSEAGFNELMRVFLDGFSKQERALFLEEHKGEQGNGFRSRQTLRPANVSMLRARACLQRVDVLRIVSTHSPAFPHGGLSGEIARFGISHLCVDLVLVIGDCALQLRATGKHIF